MYFSLTVFGDLYYADAQVLLGYLEDLFLKIVFIQRDKSLATEQKNLFRMFSINR